MRRPRPALPPLISVITIVRNSASTLERAISSVVEQDYPAVEYIVLDAGSTDGTVDIIRRYAERIAFWRSKPDAGPIAAVNEGWRRATGDILAVLCADDWLEPGALSDVAAAFRSDPSLEVITGGACIVKDDNGRLETIAVYKDPERLALKISNVLYPTLTNARFIRRSVYKELGGYNEAYGTTGDLDFLIRLALRETKSACIDRIVYNYRQHAGSQTLSRDWRKLVPIVQDNLLIVEHYLEDSSLAVLARRHLASFHGRIAARGLYVALRSGRIGDGGRVLRRAVRVNPAWPILVVYWVAMGLVKRLQRRFIREGRQGIPHVSS